MPCCSGPVPAAVRHRQREAGGFVITEASYLPGAFLAPHIHRQPCITYVLHGRFREDIGRTPAELTPRTFLLKPGAAVHADRIGPRGARILFVEPTPWRLASLDGSVPVLERVVRTERGPMASLGGRLRRELWRDDPGADLMVEALLLEMLALAGRETGGRMSGAPPWLERIRDRLAAEFAAPPTITELALAAGVHPTHVSRAFRRHYGLRPGEFVRRQRTERVHRALLESDAPLSRIAAEAGYADQSHMGREFRRAYGLTPAARRRARSQAA